jgi:hypothetical protein
VGLDDFGRFNRVYFSGRSDSLRERCGKATRHDISHFVTLFKADEFDDFRRLPTPSKPDRPSVRRIVKIRS